MNERSDPRADAAACDFLAMVERDAAAGALRPLADYQARFPGFAARIAREWEALDGSLRERLAAPLRTLGRYRVLRELGRGGQAAVWLAHDPELDRTVALKVLASEPGWLSQARRERLQREATALARLDHPGICAIYEAHLDGDTPFLAMRYVAGETLATRLRRARERPDPRPGVLLGALPDTAARIERVLALGEEIARALHAAHATGVVHRDVKPGNVMLDREDRPVLLDFGLAHTDDQPEGALTRTSEVFGSVAYLAPERLAGGGAADHRGDVYALGVVLYECLTLERPHAGTTTETLLRQITGGERRDPLRFNRALPRDLVLVLQTALETDPARRYPSALALAEDLRRLRRSEPIAARPIGLALRARRWARRHPALAASVVLLLAALAVTSTLLVQMAAQRRSLLAWQQVLESLAIDDPSAALGRALAAAPHVPAERLNGPLLQLLGRSPILLEFDVPRLGGVPCAGAFAADGRMLVSSSAGDLVVVDPTTGEVERKVKVHGAGPVRLALHPSRREVLSSSRDGTVRRLDAVTLTDLPLAAPFAFANRDARREGLYDDGLPHAPVYAQDGRRAALLGNNGDVLVTDLDAGTSWHRGRRHWIAQQLCFQPGGDLLVVRWREFAEEFGASAAQVLHAADGHEVARLDLEGQETLACAFDAEGRQLAVVGIDGTVRIYETAGWTCAQRLVAGGEDYRHLHWVDFAGPGVLVTSGFEGLVVRDLTTGKCIARHVSPSARPFDLCAWTDDRGKLAATCKDGTVLVYETATWGEVARARWQYRFPYHLAWNAAGTRLLFQDGPTSAPVLRVMGLQPPAPRLPAHRGAVVDVEFLADGCMLTASHDGSAAVLDPRTGVRRRTFPHPAAVRSARATGDGQRVVTACDDGAARVWPLSGATHPVVLAGHAGPVLGAWPFDGERRVLTIGADGRAFLFDAATGARQDLVPHRGACLCAAIEPALGLLATGGADRRVHVYDWQGNLQRALDAFFEARRPAMGVQGNATALVFDAARRRLVVANRSDVFVVFGVDDWQPVRVLQRHEGQSFSMHAAHVPGGRFYATAHSGVGDWTFVEADGLVARDVGAAHMPNAIVSVLRLAPDGNRLLVGARDGQITLWDLPRRERLLDLRAEQGLRCAEFSADGEWVATGSQDGSVRVWPVRPLPFACAHYARLRGR